MTAGWLLLIAGIVAVWMYSARRMQKQIQASQSEIQRLRETSGGLEATLKRRGRRLDVLFSAVNEVVMRVDRLGRVMAVNQQAYDLFDMEKSPELPQSMLLYIRDPDWHRSFSRALKALPEASTLPDIRIAGRVLAPRLAPLGREQALLLCVDMTEIHKLEGQRRTFLSNLMHDLKTPLTSLLGYARSLESFADDAELRKEAAQVIADEAKHVNHLLDALLTLDQIDFSSRDENAACEPATVLKQVCGMLKCRLEHKFIKLDKQLDCDGIRPAMAADNLERVLTNILENSVRHSPENGHIRVQLVESDQQCVFTIEDEGPGIPERKLLKATERFYRVDKARGRQSGNHGLGLAIVKELLELHDGKLSLSNISPHGLRVEFTLPVSLEPQT
jgi:two-component system phosphate regulon sensor histidine kinase PhoR